MPPHPPEKDIEQKRHQDNVEEIRHPEGTEQIIDGGPQGIHLVTGCVESAREKNLPGCVTVPGGLQWMQPHLNEALWPLEVIPNLGPVPAPATVPRAHAEEPLTALLVMTDHVG